MKNTPSLLILGCLAVLCGCKKNDSPVAPAPKQLIYISTIGHLNYRGSLLQSVGDYTLLYQGNHITGLREAKKNTRNGLISSADGISTFGVFTYSNLIKYSYIWEDGVIKAALLDSVMHETRINDSIASMDVLTDAPAALFYYSAGRLDSIRYLAEVINETGIQKRVFTYDSRGNIAKEVDYYMSELPPAGTVLIGSPIVTITFEYDDHPNPWHLLFEQTGVILPMVKYHNISPNNPVKAYRFASLNGNNDTGTPETYTYQYDNDGYPVSVTDNQQRVFDFVYR